MTRQQGCLTAINLSLCRIDMADYKTEFSGHEMYKLRRDRIDDKKFIVSLWVEQRLKTGIRR